LQQPAQLDFAALPGFSRLYLDYLSGRAGQYYHRHFQNAADYSALQQTLPRRNLDRSKLAAILKKQNEKLGAGQASLSNIAKLEKPGTLAVVTGQQVTLLGGSILTFYKAAIATKLADTNCRKLNTDVVPIFWMAADDADFAEVAQIYLPARDDQLHKLVLQPSKDVDGLPMSAVALDEGIEKLLDEYGQLLPDTEFSGELLGQLRQIYSPGESIVDAFGRYLLAVLGNKGLVLVDPADPELRTLAKPIYEKEVELARESSGAVAKQNRLLAGAEYHLQVTRPDNYSNLFYEDGKRYRVDIVDDGFDINGTSYTKTELLAMVRDHSERFSPNVFLRPIVQSYLLPTLVHFVGPAEVAYLAQIRELFGLFEQPAPVVYPRFSATILEHKIARLLDKYSLSIIDIFSGADAVVMRLMRESFPDDLEQSFESIRAKIKGDLEALVGRLDLSDEGLMATARKSVGKVDYEIKGLQEKVFQAHKKKNKTVRNQIERAALYLFPDGEMQERYFPLNYFIALYGPGIVNTLYEEIACETGVHHIISLQDI
jgi:bacillithiol biosynthesis cysteine-adding enzyme BshC